MAKNSYHVEEISEAELEFDLKEEDLASQGSDNEFVIEEEYHEATEDMKPSKKRPVESTFEEPAQSRRKRTTDEPRDEDVVFGELIGTMLAKMVDEKKKKNIKRSILDLFF